MMHFIAKHLFHKGGVDLDCIMVVRFHGLYCDLIIFYNIFLNISVYNICILKSSLFEKEVVL